MTFFANHLAAVRASKSSLTALKTEEENDPLANATDGAEATDGEDNAATESLTSEDEGTGEGQGEDNEGEADGGEGADNGETGEAPENEDITPPEGSDGEGADGTPDAGVTPEGDVDFNSEVVVDETVIPEGGETPEEEAAEGESEEEQDVEDVTGDEVAEVEADEAEMEGLFQEATMLEGSYAAIENYGFHKSTYKVMEITGLLSDTALAGMGLEAFGINDPKDEQAMALEALGDKIKEKSSAWAAKIVSMAKSIGSRITDVVAPIWEKISSLVKKIGAASWDGVKAAGRTVKAHPVATISAVILAIAAAAGVYTWMGGNLPVATAAADKVTAFGNALASKINGIKWPFGGVTAKFAEAGNKLSVNVGKAGTAAKAVVLDKAGWMATSVKAIGASAGRAFTTTKTGVAAFGRRAIDVYSKVINVITHGAMAMGNRTAEITGSGKAGLAVAYASAYALGTIVGKTLVLGIKIIVGGFKLIFSTLAAIGRAVGIGGGEATA